MTTAEQTASTPARKRKMAREPLALGAAILPTEPKLTKSAQIIDLLNRPEGATIEQLVSLTGWLPHTTRAALTGLRKKGHRLSSEKPAEGGRIYRILTSAENAE
ncbi:MAG: DUF3489 domain-containing protein [Novosphingobium sp.]